MVLQNALLYFPFPKAQLLKKQGFFSSLTILWKAINIDEMSKNDFVSYSYSFPLPKGLHPQVKR